MRIPAQHHLCALAPGTGTNVEQELNEMLSGELVSLLTHKMFIECLIAVRNTIVNKWTYSLLFKGLQPTAGHL